MERVPLPALPELARAAARPRPHRPRSCASSGAPRTFDSFDGLATFLRRQLWIAEDGEKEQRFRAALAGMARERDDDGWTLASPPVGSIGILTWSRAKRLTGEVSISDAVARASAYLTEHPDEARYRDSAAIARITPVWLRRSRDSGETRRDRHARWDRRGGHGAFAGLADAGGSGIVRRLADRDPGGGDRASTSGAIEVTVDSESDDRGILGLDAAIDAGALSMKVVVSVERHRSRVGARSRVVDWASSMPRHRHDRPRRPARGRAPLIVSRIAPGRPVPTPRPRGPAARPATAC